VAVAAAGSVVGVRRGAPLAPAGRVRSVAALRHAAARRAVLAGSGARARGCKVLVPSPVSDPFLARACVGERVGGGASVSCGGRWRSRGSLIGCQRLRLSSLLARRPCGMCGRSTALTPRGQGQGLGPRAGGVGLCLRGRAGRRGRSLEVEMSGRLAGQRTTASRHYRGTKK
jgi:hypothetical protein